MSMAWPPQTNSKFVLPSTKACTPWSGAFPHSPACSPCRDAAETIYQAVKVVPRIAMNEKMRMLRKEGMKVVTKPTPPNNRA